MTTAIEPVAWPSVARLEWVASRAREAAHAADELDVRLSALAREDSAPIPTLEDLGALARFVELLAMDVEVLTSGLDAARAALNLGATALPEPLGVHDAR